MIYDFNTLFPTLNSVRAKGQIRTKSEDFKVSEQLDIELSGEGEHLWMYIQKKDTNTDWLAKQLSNICQVPRRNIGFAGLKDRHAITQQWFSVQLPQISDIEKINFALPDEITVLNFNRHNRKIKTGQLDGNRFEITIRNIEGDVTEIEKNINEIIIQGVPNYFGEQRFGIDMGNITKAIDWFNGNYKVKSKNLKSLLISSARSYIFNSILAERINLGIWNQPVRGDILQLNNSNSWFRDSDATAQEISKRLREFDIHISAAMWGEKEPPCVHDCAELENRIANKFPELLEGLRKFRLKQERRSIRVYPMNFSHQWQQGNLVLNFTLQPGCYATSVIREIITT